MIYCVEDESSIRDLMLYTLPRLGDGTWGLIHQRHYKSSLKFRRFSVVYS